MGDIERIEAAVRSGKMGTESMERSKRDERNEFGCSD